jgi:hypothetical protein
MIYLAALKRMDLRRVRLYEKSKWNVDTYFKWKVGVVYARMETAKNVKKGNRCILQLKTNNLIMDWLWL